MKYFNKVLIRKKTVSILIAITFLFTNSSYGIDTPAKTSLRAPLLGNNLKNGNRMRKAVIHELLGQVVEAENESDLELNGEIKKAILLENGKILLNKELYRKYSSKDAEEERDAIQAIVHEIAEISLQAIKTKDPSRYNTIKDRALDNLTGLYFKTGRYSNSLRGDMLANDIWALVLEYRLTGIIPEDVKDEDLRRLLIKANDIINSDTGLFGEEFNNLYRAKESALAAILKGGIFDEAGYPLRLRISQSLQLIQEQRLTLSLRLELMGENHIIEHVWLLAHEKGAVRTYKKHGMEFDYVAVDTALLQELTEFERDVFEDILEGHGSAFCYYISEPYFMPAGQEMFPVAKGTYTRFVDVRNLPPDHPEFLEYMAVHEAAESAAHNHHLAVLLEFGIAQEEGNLLAYIDWHRRLYPKRWAHICTYHMFEKDPGYETREQMDILNDYSESGEEMEEDKKLNSVRELISKFTGFQWPPDVMDEMLKYEGPNKAVKGILADAADKLEEHFRANPANNLAEYLEKAEIILKEACQNISKLELGQYLNAGQLRRFWKSRMRNINAKYYKTLNRYKDEIGEDAFNQQASAIGSPELERYGLFAKDPDALFGLSKAMLEENERATAEDSSLEELKGNDTNRMEKACFALKDIGSEKAIEPLIKAAVADTDYRVKKAALRALVFIANGSGKKQVITKVAETFLRLISGNEETSKTASYNIRQGAIFILSELKDLIEWDKEHNRAIKETLLSVIKNENENPDARLAAVYLSIDKWGDETFLVIIKTLRPGLDTYYNTCVLRLLGNIEIEDADYEDAEKAYKIIRAFTNKERHPAVLLSARKALAKIGGDKDIKIYQVALDHVVERERFFQVGQRVGYKIDGKKYSIGQVLEVGMRVIEGSPRRYIRTSFTSAGEIIIYPGIMPKGMLKIVEEDGSDGAKKKPPKKINQIPGVKITMLRQDVESGPNPYLKRALVRIFSHYNEIGGSGKVAKALQEHIKNPVKADSPNTGNELIKFLELEKTWGIPFLKGNIVPKLLHSGILHSVDPGSQDYKKMKYRISRYRNSLDKLLGKSRSINLSIAIKIILPNGRTIESAGNTLTKAMEFIKTKLPKKLISANGEILWENMVITRGEEHIMPAQYLSDGDEVSITFKQPDVQAGQDARRITGAINSFL